MTIKSKALSGSSLMEYALPMAVFFLTGAVALLSGMPDIFQTYFSDSLKGTQSGDSVAVVAYGAVEQLPALYSSPTSLGAPPPSIDGTILGFDLSDYPTDLLSSIETTGGNGTTKILLATLQKYVEEQVAAGKMSVEDSQALIQLSNQGHKMAEIEKLVEDRYANSSGYGEFMKPIAYGGVVYSNPSELLDATLGWVGDDGRADKLVANDEMLDPYADQTNPNVWQIGNETREFAKIYQEAKAAGLLSDPETDLVVTALAKQIALLSGTIQQGPSYVANWEDYANEVPYEDVFSVVVASEITDINSVGICAANNGKDSGAKCKKDKKDKDDD